MRRIKQIIGNDLGTEQLKRFGNDLRCIVKISMEFGMITSIRDVADIPLGKDLGKEP